MTNQLRRHPDDLAALISRTAEAHGLPAAYVEKDFWVTEVLRAAVVDRPIELPDGSFGQVKFLFKGGTSLSRVFRIIDRFSEDVDLLVVFPQDATTKSRHKILKRVDSEVTSHLNLTASDVEVGSSTTGVKRFTTYPFPTQDGSASLREGVLLELGSRGGTYPADTHVYRSMVAEFAIGELGESETTWDEFAPFLVRVLAPERTLLEKFAAVHDAAMRGDTSTLLKYGRHFYDIGRVLDTGFVVDALDSLGTEQIVSLVDDINARSHEAGLGWHPRPQAGFAASPAFDPNHPTHATIRTGFDAAQSLIHGAKISLVEVIETVSANRGRL